MILEKEIKLNVIMINNQLMGFGCQDDNLWKTD